MDDSNITITISKRMIGYFVTGMIIFIILWFLQDFYFSPPKAPSTTLNLEALELRVMVMEGKVSYLLWQSNGYSTGETVYYDDESNYQDNLTVFLDEDFSDWSIRGSDIEEPEERPGDWLWSPD
jgi:hypothetical protein